METNFKILHGRSSKFELKTVTVIYYTQMLWNDQSNYEKIILFYCLFYFFIFKLK